MKKSAAAAAMLLSAAVREQSRAEVERRAGERVGKNFTSSTIPSIDRYDDAIAIGVGIIIISIAAQSSQE